MLEQLSPAERELMAVLGRMHRNRHELTAGQIERIAGIKVPGLERRWRTAMADLSARGLVGAGVADNHFALTAAGEALAVRLEAQGLLDLLFYEAFYERAEKSAAYARFCELVYGINLCQHGLADLRQLELLQELLRRQGCRDLLELGCGNGMTAAYLVASLGIPATGVDLAGQTITRVAQRTAGDPRLRFLAMDLNDLTFAPASFDAVIAIDSLYFARDKRRMLQSMARLLRPQGRLYVYYNPWLETPPTETVLGQILDELGYAYEAEDLTAANLAFWRRMGEVLPGLEPAFMAEGNRFLYDNRQAELVGDGMKTSRYLYSVRM